MTSTAPTPHDFLELVQSRGYVHQLTDAAGLAAHLREPSDKRPVAYCGFDCTAPSLHVGSLLPILLLRQFQRCGHKPLVLMGGGTTLIGDPSGKDTARLMLTEDAIAANMAGIRQVFQRYLTFEDTFDPTTPHAFMVNNADWLKGLGYLPFLRDYGQHFSISRMLSMDSVKLRLEREGAGLSFLEFNYMILQAYDFVKLAEQYGCRLQFGGSDQWGNIVMGTELGRRAAERALFGLTTPLLTTASGAKMGKTADGAVWLNADLTSPYAFWQYWRNVDDADVGRFLRLFTELPLADIAALESLPGAEINTAKKRLATEVTTLCHGAEAALQAAETARRTFEEGAAGATEGLTLPEITIPAGDWGAGLPIVALLVRAGLAESNGEARRLIRGGGARLNDEKITDEQVIVSPQAHAPVGTLRLSAGRKKHVMVRVA